MSFYKPRRQPQMGFVWLAPLIQLVGGAVSSQPIGGKSYIETIPVNPLAVAAAAVGGVAVVGGVLYLLWKA